MEYTMNAIETKLMGYTFRSRLEARWAAFFELCGWNWNYEPTDFRGWIPDFAIYGAEETVYVEVKPIDRLPLVDNCFKSEVTEKIDCSGCEGDILLLGQTAIVPDIPECCLLHLYPGQYNAFGWMRSGSEGGWWAGAVHGQWKGGFGFCHSMMRWHDRISGEYMSKHFYQTETSELRELWGKAHAATRWMPSRN